MNSQAVEQNRFKLTGGFTLSSRVSSLERSYFQEASPAEVPELERLDRQQVKKRPDRLKQRLTLFDKEINLSGHETGNGFYKCRCGEIVVESVKKVQANAIQSCGCIGREAVSRARAIDLEGKQQVNGCLTAICRTTERKNDCVVWLTVCDHGLSAFKDWISENVSQIKQLLIEGQKSGDLSSLKTFFSQQNWGLPRFKKVTSFAFSRGHIRSCGCLKTQEVFAIRKDGEVTLKGINQIAKAKGIPPSTARYRLLRGEQVNKALTRQPASRSSKSKSADLIKAFHDWIRTMDVDLAFLLGCLPLNEHEAEVLKRRFFISPPHTLQVIGQDIGRSKERVRQIEREALKKVNFTFELIDEDER